MYNFYGMLGYQNNARIFDVDVFGSPSNVYLTDNPEFSIQEDFLKVFPQFTATVPGCVLNMFYTIADAALKEKRYKNSWRYMMCLYIAHLATLYLQTADDVNSDAASVLNKALPRGIATSKSVDGLSISYDFMDMSSDLAGYGTFKLTTFGQQLITYVKMYRGIGMWVNG